MGMERATRIEAKWPFKILQEKPYFVTAGASCGGTILPSFNAREQAASSSTEPATGPAASSMSSNANFKAFSGKGTSIGGAPVLAVPRIESSGASASRARSTPETRSAAASSGSTGAQASGERQGSALIAKLEEKNRMESFGETSALTSTDVGHEMDPDSNDTIRASDDKEDDGMYGKVNDTEDSI